METLIIKFGEQVLQPADVVVVKNKEFPLFDHYLVYIGDSNFVVHMNKGIVKMSIHELQQFSGKYSPIRMRKFIGLETHRKEAILRAKEYLHPPYSLLFSNCEHFADFIQFGKRTSLQAKKASIGLIGVGAVMVGESKNDFVRFLGGLSMIAGVVALISEATGESKAQTALN